MNKLFLLLGLFVFVGTCAKCQEQEPPFKRIGKFYPLQLYRVFPCAAFGYEQRVSDRFSLSGEAAPFLNVNIFKTDYHSKRGVRLRGELRYYFRYKYSASRPKYARGMYGATDLYRISARYREYSEELKWRETGFGVKVGMAEYLNKVTLDYSVGLSWRYSKDLPPDLWASMMNFWEEKYPIVQPTISVAVGYKL